MGPKRNNSKPRFLNSPAWCHAASNATVTYTSTVTAAHLIQLGAETVDAAPRPRAPALVQLALRPGLRK